MRIQMYCRVKRGRNKAACDDTCLIGSTLVNDDTACVACSAPTRVYVCDGVGGNAGGKEASMFVCRHIDDDFPAVNKALIAYGLQTGKPSMATTLTGLIFREKEILLVHAGNTRLYSFRGGFLNQITTDHTTCEWLKGIGNIEGAEAYNKSEIRCAFGGGNEEYLKELVMEPVFSDRIPKTLLMTSDGIHDYLFVDRMEHILNESLDMRVKIDRMIEEAEANGSQDDCSAVILTLEEDR